MTPKIPNERSAQREMQYESNEFDRQEAAGGLVRLGGTVERVIFSSEETGYAVCDFGVDEYIADHRRGEEDPAYRKAKAILQMFPGQNQVVLYFADTGVRRGTRADLDSRMLTELKNLLGDRDVVVK